MIIVWYVWEDFINIENSSIIGIILWKNNGYPMKK